MCTVLPVGARSQAGRLTGIISLRPPKNTARQAPPALLGRIEGTKFLAQGHTGNKTQDRTSFPVLSPGQGTSLTNEAEGPPSKLPPPSC